MKTVIELLKQKNKTIATMESCTGGGIANAITNCDGSSEVFSFSAVTYSNEYKIRMGVDEKIIEKYSVYSMETAKEMAYKISCFAKANYGIGVTGKFNKIDNNNLQGDNNKVYVSIYDKDYKKYYNKEIIVDLNTRSALKEQIIESVIKELISIIK